MNPEAQLVCYLVAFIAFVVGAAVEFGTPRPPGVFWACVGLAAWALVPLWAALKAV